MSKVYYFDMDGVLSNFHKEPYKYTNAINRAWIANLEPFMENVQTVKNLITDGNTVYILTKGASEEAKQGKIDWLAKYLPEIDIKNYFICIIGYGKKVDHIREEGLLIDDDKTNINQWIKGGHEGLLLEYKGQKVIL